MKKPSDPEEKKPKRTLGWYLGMVVVCMFVVLIGLIALGLLLRFGVWVWSGLVW